MENTLITNETKPSANVISWAHRSISEKEYIGPKRLHGNSYKFICVTNGGGTIFINDVPYKVSVGDICVLYPFEYYSDRADDCGMIFNHLSITVTDKKYSSMLGNIWVDSKKNSVHVFKNATASKLIEHIVLEKTNKSNYLKQESLSFLLTAFVLCFVRQFPQSIGKESKSVELFCDTVSFIDSNFYSIENLTDISDALGHNYDYVAKVFRKMSGISIETFHRSKKLDLARRLLYEGMKISDVSKKLGYSGLQSFSKSFRNHWSLSPREYLDGLKK